MGSELNENYVNDLKGKIEEFCKKNGYDDAILIYYPQESPMTELSVDMLYEFVRKNIVKSLEDKEPKKLDKLAVLLHSYGGDASSAYLMVKLLREIANEIHGYVPSRAKSAATLFMLGTDKIFMGPTSELGPVDPLVIYPVLGIWIPAKAMLKAIEEILPKLRVSPEAPPLTILPVDPAHIGLCHLAIEDSKKYTELLLREYNLKEAKGEEIKKTVKALIEKYPSHDFALSYDECKKIGLNVEKKNIFEWSDVWDIYSIAGKIIKEIIKQIKAEAKVKNEKKLKEVLRRLSPFIIASKDAFDFYTQESY